MGTFFSAFIGKAGLYLAMVMICLIAMAVIARNWSCRESRHREPKVVTAGPYKVLSVDTGASITVATGRKDRRTSTIQLQYVQAPATGKWFQLSIDHLKEIAGESITVQYEKHGLFRGTEEESNAVETTQKDCEICNGTGVEVIDSEKMANAAFAVWMDGHLPKCQACRDTQQRKPGCSLAYCDISQEKWGNIELKFKDFKPIKQKCLCVDTYVEDQSGDEAESRGPMIGIVFGHSGIDLGFDQVNQGFADCSPDAPKAYRVARDQEKKARMGIWSKQK